MFLETCSLSFGESLAVLTSRADWNCVHPESTGELCTRVTPPYEGIRMRFWQPVLLVETVKRAGDTAINEFSAVTGEPLGRMAAAAMGVDPQDLNSGSGSSSDTTAVQVNEVHVFGYPFSNIFSGMIEAGCEGPPDLNGTISYLSEIDAVEWRTMALESNNLMSRLSAVMTPVCDQAGALNAGMCMGVWGPLYPRGGFITGHSAPVGSAAAAFRGINIASLNVQSFHQRQMPLLFIPDMYWDRMQLVYPQATQCLRIGEDPRNWENGKVSSDGKYVWIYWRKKECCLF